MESSPNLHVLPWIHPSSPLAQKRMRLDSDQAALNDALSSPPNQVHEKEDPAASEGSSQNPLIFLHENPAEALTDPTCPLDSYALQDDQSRDAVDDLLAVIDADKRTGEIYARILRRYYKFWLEEEARQNEKHPGRKPLDFLPITAMKVSLFVVDEMKRPKLKRGSNSEIAGSGVGKSYVSQIITALEYFRFKKEHKYRNDIEARTKLRNDDRIRRLEEGAKHNEPKRVESAQILKAAGSSSDTYKIEELRRLSAWCLHQSHTCQGNLINLRDRLMVLLSVMTAFRGDSARALLLSDLYLTDVPMQVLGVGKTIPALGILADNAKTNQQGRVDEHGVFRHRLVELCAIGGMALYFFTYFHVCKKPVPDFTPDFSDPTKGEYGHRQWYNYHLFPAKDIKIPMSYDNHRERMHRLHNSNNISITKVTHACREFGAINARLHGASIDETKALGGWNAGAGSYRQCYDRLLPYNGMLAAAMYDANNPETYFMARETLQPPEELICQIFPWIEAELAALQERERRNKWAIDITLRQFLNLLLWFRTVLLQDAAVLSVTYPDAFLWTIPPFNSPAFRQFAASSSDAIKLAEEDARLAFENLPEHLVRSLRGVVTGFALSLQQQQQAHSAQMAGMYDQLTTLRDLFEMQASSASKRRKVTKGVPTSAHPMATAQPSYTPVTTLPAALPFQSTFFNIPVTFPAGQFASLPSQQYPATMLPSSAPANAPLCAASGSNQPFPFTTTIPGGSNLAVTSPPTFSPTLPPVPIPVPSFPLPSAPEAPSFSYSHDALRFAPNYTPSPSYLKMSALINKYGTEKLKKHGWDGATMEVPFLPYYEYRPSTTISNAWAEWADGLDGYMAVRDLEEEWGATWRRNVKKTIQEHSRRKPLIKLISSLSSRPRWDIKLALRFLGDIYGSYSARQFIDYIKKPQEHVQAVYNAALTYTT